MTYAYFTEEIRQRLEVFIPKVMQQNAVPGLSIAVINNQQLIWSKPFGVKHADRQERVQTNTVFEAASLTKPVIAYAALKLCAKGAMGLDIPLYTYLDRPYIKDQPLHELITTRHVLSHTCGFPNHKGKESLKVMFKPGEKFSYSGEGFMYLQHVIEHITKTPLDKYITDTIFTPLQMQDSSLIWDEKYERQASYSHDKKGLVKDLRKMKKPRALGSLYTTSTDYTKFILYLLNQYVNKCMPLLNDMLRPQIVINEHIAWGLGWGMVCNGTQNSYWHWGDNGTFKAFTLFIPNEQTGLVILTNGYNGLSVCQEVVEDIYGKYPAFDKFLDVLYNQW